MREKLREVLQQFICTRHAQGIEPALEKLLDDIELEQRKAMRPICVSLAEVGLAIIRDAQDTCWVGPAETAIDRIFNELGMSMDCREGGPESQLNDFIKNGVVLTWQEKLSEAKSKKLEASALNPKNET